MTYKDDLYEAGLSGDKPGITDEAFLEEDELAAKRAGYRDHLRNKDLEERLSARAAGDSTSSSSGSSDYDSSQRPADLADLFWSSLIGGGVTALLVWLAFTSWYRSRGDVVGRAFVAIVSLVLAGLLLRWTIRTIRREAVEAWTGKKLPEE